MHAIKRIVIVALAVLGLAIVAGWLFLALPLFSDTRRGIAEDVLSSRIGQPVEIEGDVRAVIGRTVSFSVFGLDIPSETIDGVELAALDHAEFKVGTPALLTGRIDIEEILVEGMRARLVTLEDGTKSWSGTFAKEDEEDTADDTGEERDREPVRIVDFLQDKRIEVSDLELHIDHRPSAFKFDFVLDDLAVAHPSDAESSVDAAGTVNSIGFDLAATFPEDGAATISMDVGDATMRYQAVPRATASDPAIGQLSVDVPSLAGVWKAAHIDLTYDGEASIETETVLNAGTLALQDMLANVTLRSGEQLTVTGSVGNALQARDLDVNVAAQLHADNSPPDEAERLADIKVSDVEARIVGGINQLNVQDLTITTNAAEFGLGELGPVSVGSIRKTDDGKLALADIDVAVSAGDTPLLSATGHIDDALHLREFDFSGSLSVPASVAVGGLGHADDDIGRLEADFALSEHDGRARVDTLTAEVTGTDLWSLSANGTWPDITKLAGADLAVDVDIPSPNAFLAALDAGTASAEPFRLGLTFEADSEAADLGATLGSGDTQVVTDLELSVDGTTPVARGKLASASLDLSDLDRARDFVTALRRSYDRAPAGQESGVQPMVLDDEREIQPMVRGDDREVQPMVREDDRTVQPMVRSEGGIAQLREMIEPSTLLVDTDLEFDIDIDRIVGQKGVTELHSSLTAKNGHFKFGPLTFRYGGGAMNITAQADLGSGSKWLNVVGRGSGWDLGDVFAVADIDMDARGTISADFNISGPFTSPKAFAQNARGNAGIEVSNGAVASSLLELAGLGIMPWLFSDERRQGYTRIVCATAPVRIDGGRVSTEGTVIETESVQFVLYGNVNLRSRQINIHGRPRPVGKPLSRSAWPFNVTGSLNEPKFDLIIGGNRQRRTDGADVMPENRVPCRPDILQLQ